MKAEREIKMKELYERWRARKKKTNISSAYKLKNTTL